MLGAVLVSPQVRDIAMDRLLADAFADPIHRIVFGAMARLVERGLGTDSPAVIAELQGRDMLANIGGPATLVRLQTECATREPAAVDGWITRILDAYSRRMLQEAAAEIVGLTASGLPADVALERAESLVGRISSPGGDRALLIADLIAEQTARIEAIRNGTVDLGISTGLAELDAIIGGLVPERLYVVGARPGMGKTSLAYEMVLAMSVRAGLPSVIASLEMNSREVIDRLVAAHAYVDHGKLVVGGLSSEEHLRYERSLEILTEAPIEVLDDATMTVNTIRAAARQTKSRQGRLGLIVVDYLQLLNAHSQVHNRQEAIALISRSLKVLARQLEVPVIAVSQLSRRIEERSDKRPTLADLRECLAGDSLVWRADTGERVPIAELARTGERHIPVWSIDEKLRLVRSTMAEAWRTGQRSVVEVRLASGRAVKATENHPLLGFFGWVAAGTLKPGDRVATRGVGPAQSPRPMAYCGPALYEHGLSRQRALRSADATESAEVWDLAASDVFWDRVVSVVSAGEKDVYDAFVPGTHAFFANGIVTHNSGQIEQDGDVIIGIYRDDHYNPLSDARGMAELGVLKNRHGRDGTARVAWLGPSMTFFDLPTASVTTGGAGPKSLPPAPTLSGDDDF